MKNTTYATVYAFLTAKGFDNAEILAEFQKEINRNAEVKQAKEAMYAQAKDVVLTAMEILAEFQKEINRNAEVKQAKEAMYAQAKDVVLTAMDAPATITEIYEAVEGELPEGFTKGNLQYAITRLWKDEIDKTEGKVNTYSRKA